MSSTISLDLGIREITSYDRRDHSWDRRVYDQLADVIADIDAATVRPTRTAADLLAFAAGRKAVRDLLAAGKQYSQDAERWATRPVVRQARALLAARADRVAARKAAEAARTAEPNRTIRRAISRAAARRVEFEKQLRSAVLAAYDRCGYRVSESRWAGGDHSTRINVGDTVCCSGDSHREWSKNGKWSGNSSSHSITVRADWSERVAAHDLEVCDDMLTLDAEPVPGHGPELFRATWVEQGRGFDLKRVTGYIARVETDAGPTTYHAPGARAALDGVQRKAGLKPARRKGTLDLDRLARRHGDLPVWLEDSQRAGNCTSGTVNWCHAVGIDPDGTTTLREVVTGYKLRPRPEVIAVLRRVVRTRHDRRPLDLSAPPSSLESTGRVVFDNEGGFRIEPSAN